MKKEEKNIIIESLTEQLNANPNFYLTDVSELTVAKTNILRRSCYGKGVKLLTVKNTLLRKAMENTGRDYSEMFNALKGPTAIMFSEGANVPAKIIKDFRRTNAKPVLKAAFIEQSFYLGDSQLDALVSLKSKNELIADIIALLESPAKNVISALQSSGGKLAGILKTLSEKGE
ncbi:MAG: 50S ribosomal protein L10 [Bacteroidetes bacterium]|nr:50S ribosomal protein L10 [Bacteroidota bacterium]HET6245057.1 50S ribosomal protein L10 [Bacteroidia bacterium]